MKRAKRLLAIMLAAMMVSSTIDYSGMVVVNAEENDVVTETATETEAVAAAEADTEIAAETEEVTDTAMTTEYGTGTGAVNENEAGIEKQNAAESQAVSMQSGVDTSNVASEVLAELPDNDTLYEGYVQKVLYGNGIETYGSCAGDNLTGQNKELYDDIKASIKNVAANGGTTAFAQTIVNKYKGQTPYNRLKGYADEICKRVSYDKDAKTKYGDMNQMINVFDGNTATNVDSRGYAMAFQYLCDLDGGITCSSMTGTVSWNNIDSNKIGSGAYMWNVVKLDGDNYIVDVANCDDIAESDKMFMVGDNYEYKYDEMTRSAYTEAQLKISDNNYAITVPVITSQPQDTTVESGQTATFTVSATGAGLIYQWQVNRNDGKEFVDIAGGNEASYTTGKTDTNCNNYSYRCWKRKRIEFSKVYNYKKSRTQWKKC